MRLAGKKIIVLKVIMSTNLNYPEFIADITNHFHNSLPNLAYLHYLYKVSFKHRIS